MAINIYISFASSSPRDVGACEELESHLLPLIQTGRVQVRHAGNLLGGDSRSTRSTWLEQAQIIVCLLTPDYLRDSQCQVEEARGWERHEQGSARLVPVLVRAFDWKATRLFPAGRVVLPSNEKPVESWGRDMRDEAWRDVAKGIRGIVKHLAGGSMTESSIRFVPPPLPVRRSPWLVFVGIAVALLSLGLIIALPKILPDESSPRAVTLPPIRESVPATAPPKAEAPIATVHSTCGARCCGGSECSTTSDNTNAAVMKEVCPAGAQSCTDCPSDRRCVPGACSDNLSPSAPYLIRLSHAVVQGNDVPAEGKVCFRRAGAQEWLGCIPNTDAKAREKDRKSWAGPLTRIPVVLGDLLKGKGLVAEVWVEEKRWASGTIALTTNLKRTALCVGVTMRLQSAEFAPPPTGDGSTRVLFFLDDP